MKYVLVSGGVISGIGKGIIASSTGLLLKTKGLKVTAIKIDPYMNVDAGTMAPTEHGEVFVLDDGGEVDLDLGNYERYLSVTLNRENNITTGKIYQHVIERERKGDYLGRTVQVVPHLTDAIQEWIERVAKVTVDHTKEAPDVCIIELGGTIGDIESMPFIEAMRQLKKRCGRKNFAHIHVSLIPVIQGEKKTKPTQHAFREVTRVGPRPDLIACRCEVELDEKTIGKLSLHCEVDAEQVFAVHNVPSTYHVPALLERQKLVSLLDDVLDLKSINVSDTWRKQGETTWQAWQALTSTSPQGLETVKIALIGKYTNLHDSYLSVIKSLEHSAMACQRNLELIWVDASQLEQEFKKSNPEEYYKAWHDVTRAHGFLVPGGFGKRGTEGMIDAIKYARESKKPFLGVCLGMQLAVIEYARNVCGLRNAGSVELDGEEIENKVIIYMPEIDRGKLGGTMRLGLRPTYFQNGSEWSKARKLYENSSKVKNLPIDGAVNGTLANNDDGTERSTSADGTMPAILERHRHRYEVNPELVDLLTKNGLNFVGKDETGKRMEIIELKEHPYFVGTQYHGEYLSRVLEPSKPYLGLIAASIGQLQTILEHGLRPRGASVNGFDELTVRI